MKGSQGITLNVYLLLTCIAYVTASGVSRLANGGFDFLTLSQFWPSSFCRLMAMEQKKCNSSGYESGWTLHGLWPSSLQGDEPSFCNKSKPFDFSQIKSLQTQLDKAWHQFNATETYTALWKHEWNKHGTCAFSLPALRGEMSFFSQSLKLYSMQNTEGVLTKAGIVPRKRPSYTYAEIQDAIKTQHKAEPTLICLRKHKSYLFEIHLCFDKNFQPRDCTNEPKARVMGSGSRHTPTKIKFAKCSLKEQIFILPFKRPHYHFNEV